MTNEANQPITKSATWKTINNGFEELKTESETGPMTNSPVSSIADTVQSELDHVALDRMQATIACMPDGSRPPWIEKAMAMGQISLVILRRELLRLRLADHFGLKIDDDTPSVEEMMGA